ncbi:unnamed protein product, partial [Symbiodinium sp. CCMP2456]
DGELSIIEFWSWVNGHDGRQTNVAKTAGDVGSMQTGDFRRQLLNMAVEETKRKIHETEELRSPRAAGRLSQQARSSAGVLSLRVFFNLRGGKMPKRSWIATTGLDQLVLSSEIARVFHPVCCQAKVDTFLAWATRISHLLGCVLLGFLLAVRCSLAQDKNGDGTVSTEEMGQVLKQVNPKFTEAISDSEATRDDK